MTGQQTMRSALLKIYNKIEDFVRKTKDDEPFVSTVETLMLLALLSKWAEDALNENALNEITEEMDKNNDSL